MMEQRIAVEFLFDPPSILEGKHREDVPNGRVKVRNLGPLPRTVIVDGAPQALQKDEKISVPINQDAPDVCRFLAKVAHGYAVSREGINACKESFLPKIILGDTVGALSYIGSREPAELKHEFPGNGLHSISISMLGEFLVVHIQLFRTEARDQVIYEVIVGQR